MDELPHDDSPEIPERVQRVYERVLARREAEGLFRPDPETEPQTLQTLCRRVARTWRAADDDEDLRVACAASLTASAQLRQVTAADVVGHTPIDWEAIEVIDPDAAHRRLAHYQDKVDAAVAEWAVAAGWDRHLAPTGADLGRMQWPPWADEEMDDAVTKASERAQMVWPDADVVLGTFGPHVVTGDGVLDLTAVSAAHPWQLEDHPLAPLVAAWDDRAGPRQADQATHKQGIFPEPLFLETRYWIDPEKNQGSPGGTSRA